MVKGWQKVIAGVYIVGYWLYFAVAAISDLSRMSFWEWLDSLVWQFLRAIFWPIILVLNLIHML